MLDDGKLAERVVEVENEARGQRSERSGQDNMECNRPMASASRSRGSFRQERREAVGNISRGNQRQRCPPILSA